MSLDRKAWGFRIAFFVGCPALLSLPLGVFQAGFGRYLPLELSVLFWATAWISTWWVSEGFLRLGHQILRPWAVPLIAEIILANLASIAFNAFFFPVLMAFFAQHAANAPREVSTIPIVRGSIDHILAVARSGLPGMISWVLLRSLYAMLPARSARSQPQPSWPAETASDPLLNLDGPHNAKRAMSKFCRELGGRGIKGVDDIIALQASDHYVNVYLDGGRREFILARFSDAIEDLAAQDGLRIHRSFWISRRSISTVTRDGAGVTVALTNGLSCPVSIKYQGHFEHFLARG